MVKIRWGEYFFVYWNDIGIISVVLMFFILIVVEFCFEFIFFNKIFKYWLLVKFYI